MRPQYNDPVTIFSPGGHLLQVEFAENSAQRGATAVGIRCYNCVVLALEEKQLMPLQLEPASQRIFPVDKNMIMSFSGITPDARVLVSRARRLCQRMRASNGGEAVSVRDIAEYIANVQLRHTQAPDCRPFGVSCLVGGYDSDVKPRLFKTNPYGNFAEYIATTVGRHSQTVEAYLERGYAGDFVPSRHRAIKMALGALCTVTSPARRNFEVTILKRNNQLVKLGPEIVAEYVNRMTEMEE